MRNPILTQGRLALVKAAIASLAMAGLAQAADVYVPGVVTRYFINIPGANNSVDNVLNHPLYPDSADRIDYVTEMGSPQTANPNIENYGMVLKGLVTPATSGAYIFYVSGDDNCALYLSTDDNPANKRLIAREPEWNGFKSWTTADRRPASANVDPAQRQPNISLPVTLTANRRYYIEAIMKEGGGGDNLSVGWSPGSTIPATDDEIAILDASVIGTMAPNVPTFRRQPADSTITQNRTATLSAYGQGTPANNTAADATLIAPVTTIQWYRGGTAIADATNNVLTTPVLSAVGAQTFYAVLTDGSQTATSRVATVTVAADTTAPTIASALSSASFASVTVTFDEGMSATGLGTASNYSISGGVTVTGATVVSDRVVRLSTSRQPGDQQFTLTVNNLTDLAGNRLTANTRTFRSFVFKAGLVSYERWNGIGGTSLSDTTTNVVNERAADVVGVQSRFQSPLNVANDFVARLTTYVVPATTGDYVFFMSADDGAALYLSTDENPANAKLIAKEPSWNDQRQWRITDRRNADSPENRSDTFLETEWPSGNTVTLTAGRKYFLQLYYKEGGGGDNGGATMALASAVTDTNPANGSDSTLTGSLVGNFVDPTTLPPIITTGPAGKDFARGEAVTLTAVVDSAAPLTSVQWYRNKVAIPGANTLTYTIASAGVGDIGDYYVSVANANGSADSQPDNNCRLLMKGGFVVEAEDFNHGGGLTVAAANTQPVAADLYAGLDGLPGIDFHLRDQSTTAAGSNGNNYRNGYNDASGNPVDFPTAPEELGNPDVVSDNGDTNHRRRGDYVATKNYKIGWNSAGEWYNYTRNFPAGRYNAVLAASRDVSDANRIQSSLSKVTGGVSTTTQTVEVLGTIRANGTGGWSSLDILPYRAADGSVAVFELGANTTVRVTNTSSGEDHDIDYLIFYPAPAEAGRITGFRRDGSDLVIDFTGSLSSSDSLNGTYAPVSGSGSVRVPLGAGSTMRFYRAQ